MCGDLPYTCDKYHCLIGQRIINRDLSWLDFNERVLAQAREQRVPVLERAKFLAKFLK